MSCVKMYVVDLAIVAFLKKFIQKIETTIYVQTQTIYFTFTFNNSSIPLINILIFCIR
jgi:hypothetical protein